MPPAADADPPPPGYTVVARRYRPKQFADLIGQEPIANALANALASGRLAHAYLFTGPRGVGKTSAARVLAKAMNCDRGPTPTPCGGCGPCGGIAAGDDVDVIEIDAASNTGVDNVRDLKQNVGFRPQRSRFKVYIVDEVHMLSTAAFNALLKTLEEPPPHVKFIFATTEVHKLPATILSRCQRFDFAPVGPARVLESLRNVVAAEGLEADDEALELVARRAGGSMRDAQTHLDQLLAAAPGRLTADAARAVFGTAADDRVGDLADAILGGQPGRAVDLVSDATAGGLQPGDLADQLVDYWRGLMLVMVAGKAARDLPGSPALHDRIRRHADGRSLDAVLAGLDVLTAAKARMRGSPHAHVLLEVAVVRLGRLDDLMAVGELARWVAGGEPPPAGRAADNGKPDRPPEPPRPAPASPPPASEPKARNGTTAHSPTGGNGVAGPNGSARPTAELTPATAAAVWPRVLEGVGVTLRRQLELAGLPAISGPQALVVRFPPGYTAQYERCASEAAVDGVRQALLRVTGRDWRVQVEQRSAVAPAAGPAAAGRSPGPRGELLDLPLFRAAADRLEAKLVHVDEGFRPAAGDRWSDRSADAAEG